MATTKVRGITIELGADTTGLNKALSSVNTEIGQTQRELKDVEKLLKMDPGNTELLAQKQRLLSERVEETKDKLKALKDAQEDIENAYRNGDIDQGQYEAFQREIINCENELKNFERKAAEANVTAQKIAQAGEGFKDFGEKAEAAGKKLAPLSIGITGLTTTAVKVTADFDASMSKVKAISGATGDEFDALRDKAREMGSKTKFSASEAAAAMEYMAMAGWKTDDMLQGIDGIMNLAAASGTDLATTSDIVTDALTAFGKSADDAGQLADILASASSNANTNVEMMGESFKYVAPLAGAMGYSMEDTSIALGLMANSGIKASQAGTSLRSIMSRMAKPTDEVQTAMNNLGITLDDGNGNMLSFMDVMKQMRSGMGELKISEQELNTEMQLLDEQLANGEITESAYNKSVEDLMNKAYGAEGALMAQNAAALAGKNSMSALLAIVNASDEDFNNLTNAVYGSSGSAQEMADIMQDNLSGQLTILLSQLQEVAIQFGDILMPVITKVVGAIQGLVQWISNLDPAAKGIVLTVGGLLAVLAPLLILIGKVSTGVGAIMTAAPKIVGALSGISSAVSSLWSLLLANPIALVIAAIVAFVALIATKGDEIQALLQKVDDFLQGIFSKDWSETFGFLGDHLNAFFRNIKNIWDSIKKVFDGIIDFIRGVFTGDWSRAWEGIKKIFGGVFDGLLAIAKAPINGIIGILNGLISGINFVIRGLNKISFSIPSWVPGIGGKTFGINIGEIGKIPYLAKGGTFDNGSAIVGEAGAELLTLSNGAATVQPLTTGGNGGHTDITDLLQTYLPYLAQGSQIILDSGELVGATAPAMNNALGIIAMRSGIR